VSKSAPLVRHVFERDNLAGARPLMQPTDQPWDERLCYFSDPEGM